MERLPPLNSVRAFEAVARHLSMTNAAEELHVTPGAISRQIQLLEDHLGTSLLKRGHRQITLTFTVFRCGGRGLPGYVDAVLAQHKDANRLRPGRSLKSAAACVSTACASMRSALLASPQCPSCAAPRPAERPCAALVQTRARTADEAPIPREKDGLRAAAGAELVQYRADMRLYGAGLNRQLGRNAFVAQTACDEAQHI